MEFYLSIICLLPISLWAMGKVGEWVREQIASERAERDLEDWRQRPFSILGTAPWDRMYADQERDGAVAEAERILEEARR